MPGRFAVNAILLTVISIASATCGGGGSSTSPSTGGPGTNALISPTNFHIILQRVLFTNNEVQVSWSGSGSTYRVSAGAATNSTELLNVEVTGTSYTWMAPRTEGVYYVRVAATQGTASSSAVELPVFTIDLRNVIDAVFFGSGPMSDSPGSRVQTTPAAIWPDSTRLTVRVSAESGDTARGNAQTFVNEYEGLGGGISAGVEVVADDMKALTNPNQLPLLTIAIRVLAGWCGGAGIIACANIGPAPVGVNRSIVTMHGSGGGLSIAHELGHAYGMRHVHVNSSVRQELNFMMNPALVSAQMTEPEKNAIRAAREGGLRPGMSRQAAQDLGIVLPFPSLEASMTAGYSSMVNRAPSRCTVLENR